ncbi:unnamed protein product [Mortierella alpina]
MASSFTITAEPDWLEGFPTVPPDSIIDLRARAAFDHPSTRDQREHSRRALNNLARFGLVVDDSSSSPAAYIINTILTPQAPPLHLHPYFYTQESATMTLALFHDIDSFSNKSRYLPLTAAKDMAPGARPVPEPRATQSLVPVATYRTEKRKAKVPVMGRPFEEEQMERHVRRYFELACGDSLKREIHQKAISPAKKKFKSTQSRISAMGEKRELTLQHLLQLQRVPKNTYTTAHQKFISDHNLATYDIRKLHIDVAKYVGPPLLYWRTFVEREFGRVWSAEIASATSTASTTAGSASTSSPTAAPSSSTGSSSTADPSSGPSSAAYGPSTAILTADTPADDPNSHDCDASKRDLRTCAATLKQILRTDILPIYDNIVSITRQRQLTITDILTEVSVVVQKATLLLASGRLNGEIGLPEPITNTFDIRRALPSGFVFRAEIDPLVQVAELPDLLQGALERGLTEKKAGPLADLTKIFSPQCISYLYAAFYGVSGTKSDSQHPLWDKIVELISELSEVSPLSPSSSPAGLSSTITEHLKLLATAVEGIAKQLCDLVAVKPDGVQVHLPPIQEQLDLSLLSGSAVASASIPGQAATSFQNPVGTCSSQDDVATPPQAPVDDDFPDDIALSVEDIDALFEEDDDDSTVEKEPTRARLRALQALLKMLVESPNIDQEIDVDWVRRSGFAKDDFTDKECSVVVKLANLFRPYAPKRRPTLEGTKTEKPLAHVALRAPFVMIGNAILRASGYPDFTRRIAPQISSGSTHALHLGAVGVYEVLCSEEEGQFDIQDSDGNRITSVKAVTSPPSNKDAVLGSFFDLNEVTRICRKHGLKFAQRITIVDEFTVQITGEVLTKVGDTQRHPTTSKYEQRKKNKAGTVGKYWSNEFHRSGLSKRQIFIKAERCADNVKEQEAVVKHHKAQVALLVQEQSTAAEEERKERTAQSYKALRRARARVREARKALSPLQERLRLACREKYYWNKVHKAPVQENPEAATSSVPVRDTIPTWENAAVEDRADKIDISQLLQNCRGKDRQLVVGATDYGLVTMSETTAFSLPQLQSHLNQFDMLQDYDVEPALSRSPGQEPDPRSDPESKPQPQPGGETTTETFVKLPKSHRLTARQVDEITHARVVARRRTRRLAKSESVKKAMESVSMNKASLSWAATMASVDEAHSIRKEASGALRRFELSNARLRDAQTLRIRTGKCWKRLCAEERRYAQKAVGAVARDSLPATQSESHSGSPAVLPIMMIGDAGTCVGSRLKGHSRRGGSKMRAQHRQYCPVVMVDEYRTSRICYYCLQETQLVRSRRVKGQAIRTVRVHGAVECTNHDCIAVKGRYTIRPRDAHASAVIGLSGLATLTRPAPLAPFQRTYVPELETNNTSATPGPTFQSPTSTQKQGQPPTASGLVW